MLVRLGLGAIWGYWRINAHFLPDMLQNLRYRIYRREDIALTQYFRPPDKV